MIKAAPSTPAPAPTADAALEVLEGAAALVLDGWPEENVELVEFLAAELEKPSLAPAVDVTTSVAVDCLAWLVIVEVMIEELAINEEDADVEPVAMEDDPVAVDEVFVKAKVEAAESCLLLTGAGGQ